jgi:hypothetical protein
MARLTKKTQATLDGMRADMRTEIQGEIEKLKSEIDYFVKRGFNAEAQRAHTEIEKLKELNRCLTPSGLVEALVRIGLESTSKLREKIVEAGIKPGRPWR